MMDDIELYAYNRVLVNHTRFYADTMMAIIPFFDKNEEVIEYKINEWGFRGEFDFTKNLAFGCSKTFGYELNVLKSWPSMMELNNFGVPGASLQTVARLVTAWVPKVKPKAIYVVEPDPARRQIFYGETYTNLMIGQIGWLTNILYKDGNSNYTGDARIELESMESVAQFCADNPGFNLLDEDENKKIAQEARTQIENICDQNNTKLFFMEFLKQPSYNPRKADKSELARDLWHPGESWNRRVVQKFKNM